MYLGKLLVFVMRLYVVAVDSERVMVLGKKLYFNVYIVLQLYGM